MKWAGSLEIRKPVGNMAEPSTCNVKTYSMFVCATSLVPCPNFSITGEVLTHLYLVNQACSGIIAIELHPEDNTTLVPR